MRLKVKYKIVLGQSQPNVTVFDFESSSLPLNSSMLKSASIYPNKLGWLI